MSVNNQAGTVVGNYKILRQLGEGGMGEVFLAERIGIGGRVALKILHRTFVNHPEMAARFFNEARAANSIEHGGIVKVYEYGRLQEGDAFIAMEFLDGQSLRRRLQEQCPLPVDSALRIARQIAAALAAAHDKGIVHRDLKPDNVMLVPDPEVQGGERVKVLDFGIAKLLWELGVADSHTKTGSFMGTPLYMPPEQCRDTKSVGPKVDVYALGAILYELICGQPPFGTGTAMELAVRIVTEEAPPLHARTPGLPIPVSSLVHSCLLKDPVLRPTMAELTTRLRLLSDSLAGIRTLDSQQAITKTIPLLPLRPVEQKEAAQNTPSDRPHSSAGMRAVVASQLNTIPPAELLNPLMPAAQAPGNESSSPDATKAIELVSSPRTEGPNPAVKSWQQQPAFALEPRSAAVPKRTPKYSRWIGLGVLLVGAFSLATWIPSLLSRRQEQQLLASLESLMAQERWQPAQEVAQKLVEDTTAPAALRSTARAHQQQAAVEESNQARMNAMTTAAQQGNAEQVIKQYQLLSTASRYRARALPMFSDWLPKYAELRLASAKDLRAKEKCAESSAIIKEVLAASPENAEARQLEKTQCPLPAHRDDGLSVPPQKEKTIATAIESAAVSSKGMTPTPSLVNKSPSTQATSASSGEVKRVASSAFLPQVQAAIQKGNYGQAIALASQHTKEDPALWMQIGEAYCRLHNADQAKEAATHLDVMGQQRLVDRCRQLGVPVGLKGAVPAGVSVDTTIAVARADYLNGNHKKAIAGAMAVAAAEPKRAWGIIGASACALKDLGLANRAYKNLDPNGRQLLTATCRANHIATDNGVFVIQE